MILIRNLPATLRERDLAQAAKGIAAETGLVYRPVGDRSRVSGSYRCSVLLDSGRFVMLDDGTGFCLVPWRPIVERRVGQSAMAIARGQEVTWMFGLQRPL